MFFKNFKQKSCDQRILASLTMWVKNQTWMTTADLISEFHFGFKKKSFLYRKLRLFYNKIQKVNCKPTGLHNLRSLFLCNDKVLDSKNPDFVWALFCLSQVHSFLLTSHPTTPCDGRPTNLQHQKLARSLGL